jgi:chorismate dehydratase
LIRASGAIEPIVKPLPSRYQPGTNQNPEPRVVTLIGVSPEQDDRIRVAAINFLNPAPLMWDFEHAPLNTGLAGRYSLERMSPSECAAQLATGAADIGLIPVAALATIPSLRILPGCTIASKSRVRSLLLVRRANQPLDQVHSVGADTASRTTLAYARIMFHKWGNGEVPFIPLTADLDRMLARADAAIIIGDPALLALEEKSNRFARTGEELVYHDLAHEWRTLTGLPFVSAVWGAAHGSALDESIAGDFITSRDHGLANINAIAAEWARRLPVPESTIRTYLGENIHYVLDEEIIEGMRGFFQMAAELGVLPAYSLPAEALAAR